MVKFPPLIARWDEPQKNDMDCRVEFKEAEVDSVPVRGDSQKSTGFLARQLKIEKWHK